MADDDELTENEDEELEELPAGDLEADDLEEPFSDDGDNDDDAVAAKEEDEEEEEEEEEDDDDAPPRTRRRKASEEEDEDEEMLAPDDVEADLDRILKDRMVTTDEDDDDDVEDVEDQTDRGENGSRLQPKRADEQLCDSCFLLVRATAPTCPVGDDDCPIFS